MSKKINMIKEITKDAMYSITYCIEMNLRYALTLINIMLPYAMYFIGRDRGKHSPGGELIFPLVVLIFLYYSKEISNRRNKGYTVPTPEKRFTQVDDDGEVTVEVSRMQELLLYVADLEDWLQRKGKL